MQNRFKLSVIALVGLSFLFPVEFGTLIATGDLHIQEAEAVKRSKKRKKRKRKRRRRRRRKRRARPSYRREAKKDFVVSLGPTLMNIDPQALNNTMSNLNTTQSLDSGFQGFDSFTSVEGYFGFVLGPDTDLGPMVNALASQDRSAERTTSGSALKLDYSVGLLAFGLEMNWRFYKTGIFHFYLSPVLGLGLYSFENTQTDTEVHSLTASAFGPYIRGSVGTNVRFSDSFGIFLEGGYQFAQSGDIVVSEVNNFGDVAVGDGLTFSNNDGQLNFSGMIFSGGIALRF